MNNQYIIGVSAFELYLGAFFLFTGGLICFIAALGLMKFPNFFTRTHAAGKAGPLGAGLILLGSSLASGDGAIIVLGVIGLLFILLTAPVGAHLLAFTAYKIGGIPSTAISDLNHNGTGVKVRARKKTAATRSALNARLSKIRDGK